MAVKKLIQYQLQLKTSCKNGQLDQFISWKIHHIISSWRDLVQGSGFYFEPFKVISKLICDLPIEGQRLQVPILELHVPGSGASIVDIRANPAEC